MGAPNVQMREVDLSTRVPSFPGVYGAMLLPNAMKGPSTPYLCTSDTQFLRVFTPDERVEVGYDLGYYSALSFLQGSNKLWVRRVVTDALNGGIIIKTQASTELNSVIDDGLESIDDGTYISNPGFGDEDAFVITSANPGEWSDNISVMLYRYHPGENLTPDSIDAGAIEVADDYATCNAVTFTVSGSTLISDLPAPLEVGKTYYTIRYSESSIGLATTRAKALAGNAIVLSPSTIGTFNMRLVEQKCKEPDSFLIEVYKTYDGVTEIMESWVCSLILGKKDGFGQNCFIEDVLLGSNYIRAQVNADLATELIKEIVITDSTWPGGRLYLSKGSDGTAVTDSNMLTAIRDYSNPDDIPITLIMDVGYTTEGYQKEGIDTVCQYRKDCVGILSVPKSCEDNSDYINSIIDYRKNTLNINSSYSALFSPHVYITDQFNDRKIFVAPDGYVGAVISKTAANQELWYPPAGFRRGMLNVADVNRRFSKGEMDILYDNGINPIRFAPGRGILIWGQKTLSSRPSALDRLNVRLMLIVIEPAIAYALEDFVFELNDTTTRAIITSMIKSYMDNIKARKGVYDYQVTCDQSNNSAEDIDNHLCNVWLFVKPTIDIEFIRCTVAIVRTGMSFSVAATAL